jgi:pyruvate/2-oxoglutarate dehydrogenase complex dihydrolipoamide acyltransferase (E2) component
VDSTVEVAAWKAGRCAQLFLNDQDKAAVLALLLTHEEDHPAVDAPSAAAPATTDETETQTETKDKDKEMEQ